MFGNIFASAAQMAREDTWNFINRDWQKDDIQDQREDAWRATNAQMAFQERMSNTGYQRATADLQAAGLNPMLAYQQGGASSPGGGALIGGMAPRGPSHVGGILEAASAAAGIERTNAETEKIRAETAVSRAEVERVVALTLKAGFETDVVAAELHKVLEGTKNLSAARELIEHQIGTQRYETIRKKYEAMLSMLDLESMKPQELQILALQARLLSLEVPRAVNEALAEETAFKRYVSPFLKDAGTAAGAARDIGIGGRAFRGGILMDKARQVEHIHRRRP